MVFRKKKGLVPDCHAFFLPPTNGLMGYSPFGFQKRSISDPPNRSDQVNYLNSIFIWISLRCNSFSESKDGSFQTLGVLMLPNRRCSLNDSLPKYDLYFSTKMTTANISPLGYLRITQEFPSVSYRSQDCISVPFLFLMEYHRGRYHRCNRVQHVLSLFGGHPQH